MMDSEKNLEWSLDHPPGSDNMLADEVKRYRAQGLIDETAAIEGRQRAWHDINLWNTTLFTNRVLSGFHWGATDPGMTESELYPANLATENLIKCIGEALLSKASQSPVMPVVVPRGASFRTYLLVKKLNRWIAGTWRQLDLENLAVRAFLDAFLSGIGAIRLDHDGESLSAESVFFDNVIVDNTESLNRAAPQKYRIRYVVPRVRLEELYDTSLSVEDGKRQYTDRDRGRDWVPIVEAWRVGPKGRHCIASCGKLLKDEPWVGKTPPLVFFKWDDEISGFYCPSGAELLVPYQLRLNELNEVIRDAQDLCARPRLLAHAASRFDTQALDNLVARIITFIGQPPTPFTWNSCIADLLAERERVVESAFRFFGLSQMTSQAELPPSVRLDSSAGVREFRVMEDSRFLRLWTRFEKFRLELARRMVDVMLNDPQAESVTEWRSGGRAWSEEIKWSEVRELTKNQYTWSLEAVPQTADGAAARRDVVEGRIAQGRMDPEDGKSMVSQIDLEAMEDLANSRCDEQKWIVDQMEHGRFIPPEPMMNLVYGVQLVAANQSLLRQKTGVPDIVVEFHRRYVRQAMAIIQPGAEQPSSSPVQPPGVPQAPGAQLAPPIPAASPPPGASAVMNYGK